MRVRRLAVVMVAVAIAACTDATSPVATGSRGPLFELSDGAHGGNGDFFFLPPLAPNPGAGVNVTGLLPIVDICTWNGAACIGSLAHFTTDLATTTTTQPGNSETVRESSDRYIVNWHTAAFPVAPRDVDRICVSVNGQALGHADVQIVATGRDLKNFGGSGDLLVLDGQTLPIAFRIQEGALGQPGDVGCGGGAAGTINGMVTSPGLGVWAVDLLSSNGSQLIRFALGSGTGVFSFTTVDPGTYLICEMPPTGLHEVAPTSGAPCPAAYAPFGYVVTISGGIVSGFNFTNGT